MRGTARAAAAAGRGEDVERNASGPPLLHCGNAEKVAAEGMKACGGAAKEGEYDDEKDVGVNGELGEPIEGANGRS